MRNVSLPPVGRVVSTCKVKSTYRLVDLFLWGLQRTPRVTHRSWECPQPSSPLRCSGVFCARCSRCCNSLRSYRSRGPSSTAAGVPREGNRAHRENTVGDAGSATVSQGATGSQREAGAFPAPSEGAWPWDARSQTCGLQVHEAGHFCCVSQFAVPCYGGPGKRPLGNEDRI